MPAIYAHYRLGQMLRDKAEPEIHGLLERFPQAYDVGLHGPDIFFYEDPLSHDPEKALGSVCHKTSGGMFFARAAQILGRGRGMDASAAYAFGCLCHFTLDAMCHGAVSREMEKTGLSHTALEMELDRAMLVEDGLDPLRQSLTDHIFASTENAEAAASLYEIPPQRVKKSLKNMVFFNRVLLAPGKIKYGVLELGLKAVGKYKELGGLVMSRRPDPRCAESVRCMQRLWRAAGEKTPELWSQFLSCIKQGSGLSDPLFRYNFDGESVNLEGST